MTRLKQQTLLSFGGFQAVSPVPCKSPITILNSYLQMEGRKAHVQGLEVAGDLPPKTFQLILLPDVLDRPHHF
jgi:hypothetical protein